MTRGDRLLIAALAAALLIAWPLAAAAGQDGDRVVIDGPTGTSVFSLDEDADLVLEGVLGHVDIRIASGSVSVTDSGCPDRVCVHAGAVSAPGSVIACVPNAVVVRVEGRADERLDAVVR